VPLRTCSGISAAALDLEAVNDTDHVLAIFKVRGCWGAVAKSNFSGCRYREPVYRTLRELAMSYFNIYFNLRGERTLRRYSQPVDLSRFDDRHWMTPSAAFGLSQNILHHPAHAIAYARTSPAANQTCQTEPPAEIGPATARNGSTAILACGPTGICPLRTYFVRRIDHPHTARLACLMSRFCAIPFWIMIGASVTQAEWPIPTADGTTWRYAFTREGETEPEHWRARSLFPKIRDEQILCGIETAINALPIHIHRKFCYDSIFPPF